MFYSSPLSKLDRITLQLVGSNGEGLNEIFQDTDILKNCNVNNEEVDIDNNFYYNTFEKDRLYNTNTSTYHRVTQVNHDLSPKKIILDTGVSQGDNLINITNQIEYIFEVKTQEPDPTNDVRPILV